MANGDKLFPADFIHTAATYNDPQLRTVKNLVISSKTYLIKKNIAPIKANSKYRKKLLIPDNG